MPRQKFGFYDLYEESKKDEITSYVAEFSPEQIEAGILQTVSLITNIMTTAYNNDSYDRCFNLYRVIRKNFEESDQFPYKQIRAFINKDQLELKEVIDDMFENVEKPAADKMPRYLEILSKMSKDCIDICVTKFGQLILEIKKEEAEEVHDNALGAKSTESPVLQPITNTSSFVERFAARRAN